MTVRAPASLPAGVQVFQRGWLSSNNILLLDDGSATLIDSGYATHAVQTLALIEHALAGRALDLLANTHLHSDHCGGNAALQARYAGLHTLIPPGLADPVQHWRDEDLSYRPTGQTCPPFAISGLLLPGSTHRWGHSEWQVHAAPGHDTHSVILFEPVSRTLVSADALWERGFGVVFPELDGESAFDEVADTLDLIEFLQPAAVIPGHGAPFDNVSEAIAFARKRLDGFVAQPAKHLQYAAKVLLKFKLLEAQHLERAALVAWAQSTAYFTSTFAKHFAGLEFAQAVDQLVADLVRSGAATTQGTIIYNA